MTATNQELALALLVDYALDLRGMPQGLTEPELQRAGVARHGAWSEQVPIARLKERGLIKPIACRRCEVTGKWLPAWLPRAV